MESQDNFAYLLPFIFLTFGLVFLAVARLGDRSAPAWGFGYIAAALGFATPMLLGFLPPRGQAVLANAFFFTAFYLYGEALLLRFHRPRLRKLRMALWALGMVTVVYFILAAGSLRGELLASDFFCVLLLAVPLAAAVRYPRRAIDLLLFAMVFLVFVETLIRFGATALAASDTDFDRFLASDYAFAMQVGASILGFLMALTALAATVLDIIGGHQDAAHRDPLTNALNRRGFDRAIAELGEGAERGVVICSDVDHFKRVNDEYGHAAGDVVITILVELFRRQLPEGALIARFGGEEFVAFLPGMSLTEGGVHAEVICHAFANRRWETTGIRRTVTASFGVSVVTRNDRSVHDAISRADSCLYAAKDSGRNRVVIEGRQGPGKSATVHSISAA
ncbi:diguanylate cyclase [Rhizobiales bacterium RZME27]|uniref:diguanylate cyclase n=1 Tax=Endobacterium cereale TaxID=2663029 RepID=A0A6A8A9M6_9HYPH|nr:GGDEF domain-containing protein [Endobacterium cereale]MEB2847598.1 GGDEF domain-containing protein [Endobacterium cereale]MQY47942.1 diguanylate cyclase [Endobacterium cereale]